MGGSDGADKTYVDLRIKVDPQVDTNPLNEAHTFTATVESKTGNGAWTAVGGASVAWTISPTPSTVGTTPCVTNANGKCTYTINSNAAGVFEVNVSTTVAVVAGQPLTRSTVGDAHNIAVGGSDSAFKTYVNSSVIVTKTVNPAYTAEYKWEITKTVDGPLELFDGQSGQFTWKITTTKSLSETNDYKISGQVTIANQGTLPITVNSVADRVTGPSYSNLLGAGVVNCGSLPAVIAAGGNRVCTYTNVPVSSVAALNTFTATLSTGEKAVGTQVIAWGQPTTKVDDVVDVVDTNAAKTWPDKSASFTDSYTTNANCVDTSGMIYGSYVNGKMTGTLLNVATVKRDNTAIVLDTDDATGTANCYRLTVTKTAAPTLTRTWDWNIVKDVNTHNITATFPITGKLWYTVTVTKGAPTDSNWAVTGNVNVVNPAPMPATLTTLTDTLGTTPLTLTCPGGNTSVAAASTKTCTYSTLLPNGTTQTNTARAVAYGKAYQGTASVNFGSAVVTPINQNSVNVTDRMSDTLSTVIPNRTFTNVTDGGKVYYQQDFCENIVYGANQTVNYTINNRATIDQNGKSDAESVLVHCTKNPTVTVTKSVTPSYTAAYSWQVKKTVTPLVTELFDGESGTLTWKIEYTKSAAV